jgi:hypothetical protein
MAVGGAVMGGLQGRAQAGYEADMAKQNARLAMEQARDSRERGELEARDFFRQAGKLKGEQAAALAANGLDMGYGSALTVQQDTAQGLSEDADNLYRNIGERTRGFEINAQNFVSEARAAKMRGKAAMTQAVFQAGSSLTSGFSQYRELQVKQGRPLPRWMGGTGRPRP